MDSNNDMLKMLSPLRELLQGYQVILASSSVQRRDILNQIGLKFTSIPSPFDEESLKSDLFSQPEEFVKTLAHHKAFAVAKQVKTEESGENEPTIVIGADTVIVDRETIIGKPHVKERAVETLTSLSGNKHKVCTGVSILLVSKEEEIFLEDLFVSVTEVEFANLKKETISTYVETGEPLNKAGAYGIQGLGASLVKSIKGDYYNVVGFPLQKFCERLGQFLTDRKA